MERTIGQYRLLERIGEGGLGEVYRARDTRLGRTVVVKCVPPDVAGSAGAKARLATAAGALKSLSHPHVAEVYDLLEEGDDVCLVSEYVEGETLAQLVGGRPLNPRRAAELASQVADALAHAHSVGLLHLDLRPETIIVTRKGQAKVLDIGLSDFTRAGARRRAVASGLPDSQRVDARSLSYVSPEQALGEDEDARSDIFSLGAILYEMLTGEAAFQQHDANNTVLSVLRTTPAMPSERNAAVPRYYDTVVGRMLAKTLHGRYDSARAAAVALRSLANRSDAKTATAPRSGSKRWVVMVVAAVAVLAIVLVWWITAGS